MGYGDELMMTGIARRMQQTDPRKVRVVYAKRPRNSEVYLHNPRIAQDGEKGDFQELRGRSDRNLRPYHSGKSPTQWRYNLSFRAEVGELYFDDDEKAFGALYSGRVIIEPGVKPGASPNKQWGVERWAHLVGLMRASGIVPTQLGPPGVPRLAGVDLIETASFRQACAVVARARACVLPEGGLHHAAAAVGTPAVVIFGGFTPVELTGYALHTNLGVSLGEACGMRLPCPHCAAEMARITAEQVMQELQKLLT
jgi:ADP-heptose:LPS heptosyltransferase